MLNFDVDKLNHTGEDDNREIFIYTFEDAKEKSVLKLGINDGMVSHVKFLKKKDKVGTKIFYVKNAREIIMYDIVTQ